MKIIEFRIKNFRSIKDTGSWKLSEDRIDVLIGKNASGKSSILDSLKLINKSNIISLDRPLKDTNSETEITIEIKFEQDEMEKLFFINLDNQTNILKVNKKFLINGEEIFEINGKSMFYYFNTITRDINALILRLKNIEIKETIRLLLIDYDKMDPLLHDLGTLESQLNRFKEDLKTVEISNLITEILDAEKKIRQYIENIRKFKSNLMSLFPDFISFNIKEFIPFENELFYNSEQFEKSNLYKLMFESMKLQIDFFIQRKGNSQVITQLAENRSIELENYLNKNWHRKNVEFDLKFHPDRFVCFAKDRDIYLHLNQLSAGEIWLFIFLNFVYNHVKSDKITFILIDEPSINLHPNAQKDVIRILEDFLNKNDNLRIIYSTHSPYLIPPEKLYRISYINKTLEVGTKIYKLIINDLCARKNRRLKNPCTEDTVKARLSQMLSIAVREGFFGTIVVLCEGPTELLSIPIWAKLMRENFDDKGIILIQTNGKYEMIDFAEFFSMYSIPVFLVFDNDDKPNMDVTKRKEHIERNRWFLEFAGVAPIDFPAGTGECYFAFNPSYEDRLKEDDDEYSKIEEEVSKQYGTSGKKGIRARFVALKYQELNREAPKSIKELIIAITNYQNKFEF